MTRESNGWRFALCERAAVEARRSGLRCARVNDRIVTDAAELSEGQHFSIDMHAFVRRLTA